MIIQIRVDDRLIHGQIAVVWSKQFNTTHMVVANDKAAKNEVQQMTLKMATPNGIKVLIEAWMLPLKCLIIQIQGGEDVCVGRQRPDALKIARNCKVESINVAKCRQI